MHIYMWLKISPWLNSYACLDLVVALCGVPPAFYMLLLHSSNSMLWLNSQAVAATAMAIATRPGCEGVELRSAAPEELGADHR